MHRIAQHEIWGRDGAAPLDRDPADDDVAIVLEGTDVLALVHPQTAGVEFETGISEFHLEDAVVAFIPR